MGGRRSRASHNGQVPKLTFVETRCSKCRATMPPGDARKSCSSCLNEKKDGRSAQSRAKKMKTTKCTKCPNDLDPHPTEAKYRRCRRCREETTRTQRRQGVKPKTGRDEICPLCDGVMIDSRYESCEACRCGPRVITLSGRRCKDQTHDQTAQPTTNESSTSGDATTAVGSSSGFTTTPYVYPDLPPPSTTFCFPSLPSTSQNHNNYTPSNASGSNLSLTPLSLSFADSVSSNSPYTSWNGTPCSAYGKPPPLLPQDSPFAASRSVSPIHTLSPIHIRTGSGSGSGRMHNTNRNYPQSASVPLYSHPLPYDADHGATHAFNYEADSRLRMPSPIFFSNPLPPVPLPDKPDSHYDYDPATATATSAGYPSRSSPLDILDPIYHEQPVLMQNSVYHHDHDVAIEVEGIHVHSSSAYAVPSVSDGGGVDADVDDPDGIAEVRAGYFFNTFNATAPEASDSNSNSNISLPTVNTDSFTFRLPS